MFFLFFLQISPEAMEIVSLRAKKKEEKEEEQKKRINSRYPHVNKSLYPPRVLALPIFFGLAQADGGEVICTDVVICTEGGCCKRRLKQSLASGFVISYRPFFKV